MLKKDNKLKSTKFYSEHIVLEISSNIRCMIEINQVP